MANADATLPPAIDDLLSWSASNGATLHSQAEIYNSPTFGVSLRVKSSENDLPAHSTIVSTSYTISLSFINALDVFKNLPSRSPPFPEEFLRNTEANVVGRFFLMQQYLMGEQSYWAPYIKSLPQPNEPEKLATPLYWPESDLEIVNATNLLAATQKRVWMWNDEFAEGKRSLGDSWDSLFQGMSEEWGKEMYTWASTIFSSRSFVSTLIPPHVYGEKLDELDASGKMTWREHLREEGPYPVLFPLLDIANHNPTAKVEWFVDAQSPIRTVSVKTDDSIKAGEQIFNNYAPKANTELLLGYGFMLDDNDDVAVEFRVPEYKQPLRKAQESYVGGHETQGRFLFHVRSRRYGGPSKWNQDKERFEPIKLDEVPEDMSVEEYEKKRLKEYNVSGSIPQKADDLRICEPGLIDTLSVLVANEREEQYITDHPEWFAENDIMGSTVSYMGRNVAAAISVLKSQLEAQLKRLIESKAHLEDKPRVQTPFTNTAERYRDGQTAVLQHAVLMLGTYLASLVRTAWTEVHGVYLRRDRATKLPIWPTRPFITLNAAYWYLAEQHGKVSDNLSSSLKYLEEKVDKATAHEAQWACWVTLMLVMAADQREEYVEHLAPGMVEWTENMLEPEEREPYTLRPLPEADDETYKVLIKLIERSPKFTGMGFFWGDDKSCSFKPLEAEVGRWNKKKPRPKRGGESDDEWKLKLVEDYFHKMAICALKIVRGEGITDYGGQKPNQADEIQDNQRTVLFFKPTFENGSRWYLAFDNDGDNEWRE